MKKNVLNANFTTGDTCACLMNSVVYVGRLHFKLTPTSEKSFKIKLKRPPKWIKGRLKHTYTICLLKNYSMQMFFFFLPVECDDFRKSHKIKVPDSDK